MRIRRAITATLISIGLAASLTTTSAARRPATRPQPRFQPRGELAVIVEAQPGGMFRAESFGRLLGLTRDSLVSLRQRLYEFGGFDPVPDQQSGGTLDSGPLGTQDRGEFDAGGGPAHDPIYIGPGPIGPDWM